MEQQSSQPGYAPGGVPGSRPGQVTAAAVILFVVGGLGLLLWLLALIASLSATGLIGDLAVLLTIVSIVGIAIAGAQIYAGVGVLRLRTSAKTLAIVLSAITIVLQVLSLISGFEVVGPIIWIALNAAVIVLLQQNQHVFTR
jgi:hypothetical protein